MRPDRRRRQAMILAPGEKLVAGPGISPAGVRVANVGGEKFDIAPGCFVAEIGDQCRHHKLPPQLPFAFGVGMAPLSDGKRSIASV
jgi:hypothetical protein